ncbi:MAG: deoxyribodipyrimidine photo-lyase [Candidatus Woesearchaeota archaeon]
MNILYLHQEDLRVHDNQALLEACEHEVLAVYVHEQPLSSWTALCLQDLQTSYQEREANLLVLRGETQQILLNLIHTYDIDAVYCQETTANKELLDALAETIPVKTYETYTLYLKKQLPKTLPSNKEEFIAVTHNKIYPPLAFAPPKTIPCLPAEYENMAVQGSQEGVVEPGEQAALQALHKYFLGEEKRETIQTYFDYGLLSVRKAWYDAQEEQTRQAQELLKYLEQREYELQTTLLAQRSNFL